MELYIGVQHFVSLTKKYYETNVASYRYRWNIGCGHINVTFSVLFWYVEKVKEKK